MHEFDVVGLGEPLVEFNQIHGAGRVFQQGVGGDTFNAIIAAARHGARTAYCCRIGGADEFGQLFYDTCTQEGVDASGLVADPEANNGLYFIQHDDQGHHFSYVRRYSASSRMQVSDLRHGLVERTRYLHVSGISLALGASVCDTVFAAMDRARAAGGRVCLDPNLRLKLWSLEQARTVLCEAIRQADIFLPGIDDMRAMTGLSDPHEILAWIRSINPQTAIVLKLGHAGVAVEDNGGLFFVPPYQVQSIDATGAGDCFAGSLLARLAANEDLPTAVHYANAAAALSTTRFGAIAALPDVHEVSVLMSAA